MARLLKIIGIALLGLIGLVVVAGTTLVVLLENGTLNPLIERRLSAMLGREVRLGEPIDIQWGWSPAIAVGPLSVGNPDWAGDGPMLTVQRVEAAVSLPDLMRGEMVIPRVVVDAPEANLTRLADGRASWQLEALQPQPDPAAANEPFRLPRIDVLEVKGAKVHYDDAVTGKKLDATVDARMAPENGRSRIVADIGVSDRTPGTPEGGEVQTAHLDGWIADPQAPQETFELTATSKGERAGPLLALAGVDMQDEVGGYDLMLKVGRDAQAWRLVALEGRLGDSKVQGRGSVRDPVTLEGLEFTLDSTSPEPGDLLQAFGLGEREVPGLELKAQASRNGERNEVTLTGSLGRDDIRATASTVGPLAEMRGVVLKANAKGTNLGRLLPLFGLTEKPVPAYALDTTITREGEGAVLVDVAASLGNTRFDVDGHVGDIEAFQALDLKVAASGTDPSEVLDLFGLPKISLPPYKIAGRMQRNGELIRVDGLDGRVGQSDVAGAVAVDLASKPVAVTGDLASDRVDFDDLAGLIGLPSASTEDEAASAQQKKATQAYQASDRLLPDAKIDAAAWRNLDLDIRYRGKAVNAPKLPIQDLAFHVVTRKGWLTLDPFQADIAGGRFKVNASLDGSSDAGPVRGDFDVRVAKLQLNEFLKRFDLTNQAFGVVGGRAQLKGTGASLRQLAASADGRIALSMEGGSAGLLIPELAGLDVGQSLLTLFEDEADANSEKAPIRCLLADFDIADGVMRARTVLLDTPKDKMTIDGTIDLGSETLDLMFHAYPRDASVGSSRMPISIEGPIKSPTVGPAPGYVENRTLGWVLAPLAALVPFVELGSEDDHPCVGVADRVPQQINP